MTCKKPFKVYRGIPGAAGLRRRKTDGRSDGVRYQFFHPPEVTE
jgi:hypothetical protein